MNFEIRQLQEEELKIAAEANPLSKLDFSEKED